MSECIDPSKKPLISIVTPSYEQGEFLVDTIRSVMHQDYPRIEHWVIDGGSTDETIDILKRFEHETGTDERYTLRWLSEPDRGQSHAINKGFDRAEGDIIGWLNSDDMYFDKQTFEVVEATLRKRNASVLYGDDVVVGPDNNILRVDHKYRYSRSRLLRSCYICQPAVFFRRAVLEEDRLNESLDYVMDYELWLRLSERYNFIHLNRIVAVDRNHRDRKILNEREEMLKEGRYVQKKYGQEFGPRYGMGRLTDKLYSGWNRLRGAATILNLVSREDLIVSLDFNSWLALLSRQLFAKNRNLV